MQNSTYSDKKPEHLIVTTNSYDEVFTPVVTEKSISTLIRSEVGFSLKDYYREEDLVTKLLLERSILEDNISTSLPNLLKMLPVEK